MGIETTHTKTLRYEVKFAVDILDAPSIEASILMHPASFSKAYEDRQVNNIYLDSPTFQCFHQNIEGHPRRKKMRLRWYGPHDMPTKKSTLEIKNKDAELGWKDSFSVDGSLVKNSSSLLEAVASSGYYQGNLTPTLHNCYHRSYYISQDGLFRITLDWNQSFKIPFTPQKSLPYTDFPVIVELKYDQENADRSKDITDYLAFRQTKNSKYTVGIQELYF
ncbi:MAG: polyphosphate polymerase domain-containing protein [Saprospiraceae bacterium]|nr:polyphosphate polymerase domain-containing protein [Saprospiraceae bacterium]